MIVATYNIRLGIQDGLQAVADVLKSVDADIVAVQEIGRHWVMGPNGDSTTRLAQLANYPHFMFVPSIQMSASAAQYGHALLSREPITSAKIHQLPQNADEPRTALSAQIGATRVISTHLSHIEDVTAQIPALVALLSNEPWVLLGDLNLRPTELQELASHGVWADAAAPTFPSSAPERRIDHIAVSEGRLENVRLFGDSTASDHLGVTATWVTSSS